MSIRYFDLSDALICLLVGQSINLSVLIIGTSKEGLLIHVIKNQMSIKTLVLAFRELRRSMNYIKYIVPEAFIGILLPNLPLFIIEANFNDKITADYALIYKIVATPLSAITQSISGILYPLYIKLQNQDVLKLFRNVTLIGSIIWAACMTILFLYFHNFSTNTPLFIDNNKSTIFILLCYFGISSIFNSLSGIHLLFGLQRLSLLFTLLMLTFKLPVIFTSWTSVTATLLSIYLIDIIFVLSINIICYKRILKNC